MLLDEAKTRMTTIFNEFSEFLAPAVEHDQNILRMWREDFHSRLSTNYVDYNSVKKVASGEQKKLVTKFFVESMQNYFNGAFEFIDALYQEPVEEGIRENIDSLIQFRKHADQYLHNIVA